MRALTRALLAVLGAGCAAQPASEDAEVETASSSVVSVIEAQHLLYPSPGPTPPSWCASGTTNQRIECLLTARYASAPTARNEALALFRENGGVAGLLPAERYDG